MTETTSIARPNGRRRRIVDGHHLRWMRVSDAPDAFGFADRLTDAERERLAATVDGGAATRFVLGRMLLRSLAAEITGAPPASIGVRARCAECRGPHGRPHLTGSPALERLHASIAHCDDAVVVAASVDGPLGVDIEAVEGDPARLRAIAAVAGAPVGTLGARPDALRHWTRIEAVLKADGRGLLVDPARVRMGFGGGHIRATIGLEPQAYRVADVELDPAFRVALAVAETERPRRSQPPTCWRRSSGHEL